jgi:hypothetical protein
MFATSIIYYISYPGNQNYSLINVDICVDNLFKEDI